jgi:DNA-binding NtrC family response regulator
MGKILVVDDEAGLRGMLDIILRRDGHQVVQAGNGQEAIKFIDSDPTIELVLSDLRMEPIDGLGLLAHVRQYHPDMFVIIMTAFAEWDTAVRAMRLGAYNFLRKPFDNQVVRTLVARALDARGHYLAARAQGSDKAAPSNKSRRPSNRYRPPIQPYW